MKTRATRHETKRASSKSFRQARPHRRKQKKESISSNKPPPSREQNIFDTPPIDIDARLRMTTLCMNRILGEPGISRQIVSQFKSLLGWIVEERVTQITRSYWIKQTSLDFNASIENLQEVVLHVNEIVGFMRHYPDDVYIIDTSIWVLGQLCRFVALRPFIGVEALCTAMVIAKRHDGQEPLFHDRLFSLLGSLLQVDDELGAVQGLLTDWKNQIVDQFLDGGLQSRLLAGHYYNFRTHELVLLLHINLVHRPSSKHHDQASAFMDIHSSIIRFGGHFLRYTLKDLRDSMSSWQHWMIERYSRNF
jgi:hypothetical protein